MKRTHILFLMAVVGLVLEVLAGIPARAGSPFYLTVERSFADSEKPRIRLDYTTTDKPMLIRVLRPDNLERFLDGQFQISRSYEQPVSELNPGHYFLTGVNEMKSPVKTLRNMLDGDFRKNFRDTSLSHSVRNTTSGDLATPPEKIIHGPPKGFALVRETYIDLQYGGTTIDDLGWWFGDAAWSEDQYKIRTIALDPLPDGVYLIQAVQGDAEGQCLMQVSSLSVQVKQSTKQLVVRVIDRQLAAVAGAAVSYRDGRGTWRQLPDKTNQAGELVFAAPEGPLDGKLVVRVETNDGRKALVDTDFLPTVTGDDAVFIMTDRPIFKPGETFFYKGTVRAFDEGRLRIPKFDETEAEVSLIAFNGDTTELEEKVELTPFGSFSGSFALDSDQAPGLYRLIAQIGQKPYGGEFRVRDYVKPTFYMELVERSATVRPGGKFFIKFRTKRYSGGVPAGVKYEVFLYRKKFEAPQWVMEAGGGLSTGVNYQGEIQSAGALSEPTRIYSSVEKRLAEKRISPTSTWDSAAEIDASGEATYEFELPKMEDSTDEEWIYTIMVRALDGAGSQALLTDNIYMTLSDAQVSVRFSKTVAELGEKGLKILLRTTTPDGKPAPRSGGTVDVLLDRVGVQESSFVKLPFTTNEQGESTLDLPPMSQVGRLRAVAVLETYDGAAMRHVGTSQPALMIIGGKEGEPIRDNRQVELYTESTLLTPGEKARVLALLPTNWGTSEQGIAWETLAGDRIHETRSSTVKGRSHWFEVEAKPRFGTGFHHTVSVPVGGGKYAEQTLGFRIIPREKRLAIAIAPERELAEPLKPFRIDFEVKNSAGEPSAETELAVTIVDRAVYAVQQEMRPGIFDFFYPLPRLNLATFYSDELQGYGFADILKKPNFRLGALKSQSKLTKKTMRDTAGWFPHVVTDKSGRASITVDMPGNVTEWLITAVAADKDGRVGEEMERFKTVTDISVDVVAPQFLRHGEEAEITVTTTNHLPSPLSVTSLAELLGASVLKKGEPQMQYTLDKQAEHLWPLRLAATGDRGAATLRVRLSTTEKVHVGGAEEFDIPLKPSSMRQSFPGVQQEDRLITELPASARVASLAVQVNSGLLGAALNGAAVLVSYPYGCTEQLVHSTIPNLVLMDLIRRAGIQDDELGPLAEALTKAEKNGALGIKKILQNQNDDGGFGLWPSDRNPSTEITLTALHALKFAKDLGVTGAEQGFDRGIGWLSQQAAKAGQNSSQTSQTEGGQGHEFTALDGYRLSRMAEIGWPDQPWQEEIDYVTAVGLDRDPDLLSLVYALKIFAAHQAQSWNVFNERLKDTTLRQVLIDKLLRAVDELVAETHPDRGTDEAARFMDAFGFGYGMGYTVSSALGVLNDLGALPPELAVQLERLLITGMKNGYWTSTFDTAQVILNTRGLLANEAVAAAGERGAGLRKVVLKKADGSELGSLKRIPAGFAGRFDNPGGVELLSQLEIEGLVANDFASVTVTAEVPYASVAAKADGVSVQRRLYRITPTGREEVDPALPLPKGTAVVSEIEIQREPWQPGQSIQSRFLVVEDGVPSLARTIEDDRTFLADAGLRQDNEGYWAKVKQTIRYPDKTVRIVEVRPGGSIRLYQAWQTTFAGTASLPPASAFDMYDESIQGNTAAQTIHVEQTAEAN